MEGEQTKHKDSLNSDAHECAARSRMKHGQLVIGPAGSGKVWTNLLRSSFIPLCAL